MILILNFKIRASSRTKSYMPLFRGRLLSNQDVPNIERKHGEKKGLLLFARSVI
jgi:hypothetical protein